MPHLVEIIHHYCTHFLPHPKRFLVEQPQIRIRTNRNETNFIYYILF